MSCPNPSTFASKFKNPQGIHYTQGMFLETQAAGSTLDTVIYTLKSYDHRGYPSLRRLYLESMDPTEYSFAIAHLDGWGHWVKLRSADWFQKHLTEWRDELEVKIRSQALQKIRLEAQDDKSKSKYQANRFLVMRGWEPPAEGPGAGRPSKDAIRQAADRLAQESLMLDDHADALGLRN